MSAKAKTTVAIHTGEGPVWITAGATIPRHLLGLINPDLVENIPDQPALPASNPVGTVPATPAEAQAEMEAEAEAEVKAEGPLEAEPTLTDAPAEETAESELADTDTQEEPVKVTVPYASYKRPAWVEYAESVGVATAGLNKASIIHAIAAHMGISTDGLSPAAIADAIRLRAA